MPNAHGGTIATSTALHGGGGGSWHKDKCKCSNNGQTFGDVECNHNGHNDAIRHAEIGKEDANVVPDSRQPGFGGLEQKDKGR